MRLHLCLWLVPALACASPGMADTAPPPRCAILGQMAVASWLELAASLGRNDPAAVAPVLSRLNDLTGLHSGLGCDTAALGTAMDCVLERSGTQPPRELARACMQEAGLSGTE